MLLHAGNGVRVLDAMRRAGRKTTRRRRATAPTPDLGAIVDNPPILAADGDDGDEFALQPEPDTPAVDDDAPPSTKPPKRSHHAPPSSGARSYEPRLSLRLTESGAFNVDAMSPKVREQLDMALRDADVLQKLGLQRSTSPTAAGLAVDVHVCNVLYEALGSIAVALAQRAGYEPDEALLMRFSQGERDLLNPPTVTVLNKYLGATAMQDEVILALTLAMILTGKISQLRAVHDARASQGHTVPFDRAAVAN
jgi:hypothetical protein